MSKSTPLEHLPNVPGDPGSDNVQMQMLQNQPSNSNLMPPRPPADQQFNQDMRTDYEDQRMDDQSHYMQRQFIPQSGMGQPQNNMYENNNYQNPNNNTHIQNKNENNVVSKNKTYDDDIKNIGIFQLLMAQSKTLSIVFALLLCVQLETTQGLIRKLVRMLNVPENMLFIISKVIIALLGVIVFFFVLRNL